MRKQITTTLKFSELDKMTFHEVIRMMGFSFNDFNEVTEKEIMEDCKRLPTPVEYRNMQYFIFRKTLLYKTFLLIYLFNYKAKFGAMRYSNWNDILKALCDTLGTENSVFRAKTNLIKPYDNSIIIDIDKNAFLHPLEEFKLLKYDNVHLDAAPEHLASITGLDCQATREFCGGYLNNLAYEVKEICDNLRQTEEWHFKHFCDNYNLNNPSYTFLFTANGSKYDTVLAADYLYFLFIVKITNDWDVSRTVLKKYLESNNEHNINAYELKTNRHELLQYFNEIVKLYDPQMSFCYEEHLFALKNYFKAEYVLNLTETPSGIDTEQYDLSAEPTKETNTVNPASPIADLSDNPAVKDEPSDFVSIANKQIDLYKKKNRDYGNATDILYKKHGFTYYQIMLEQKMQRIDSITNNNKVHNFESLEDSLLDLSNYAILAVESLRKEKQCK